MSFTRLRAVGLSGNEYELWAYPLGGRFERSVGGVYALCWATPYGYWLTNYIGQGGCLDSRVGVGLFFHHKVKAARELGATHVAVMAVPGGEDDRAWVENDLIQAYLPVLNEIAPPSPFRRRA